MKYLLSLLLVLIPFICFGQGINPVGGCTRAYNTCALIDSPIQTTYTSDATLGHDTNGVQYLSIKFTAGANATLRTVVLQMSTDNNAPDQDVVVALCTDNEGVPNVCTNADAVMSNPGVAGYKYLRWSAGYAITSSSVYHIRVYTAQDSDTNYYKLQYNNDVSGSSLLKSADGSSWSNYAGDSSAQGLFELSECVTYTH
jgi:hypothetical protein